MSTDLFDQTLATITDFSFSDKLRLNSELATLLKKEGKTGAVGKAVKAAKSKASDGEKPKRKAAPGTLAWMAFVKHCKTTMAERFEGCTKEPERLTICKAIRSEDSATYDAFIKEFKENHSSSAPADDADADAAEPEPVVPAPTPASKAEKLAAAKAAAAAKKAAPATPATSAPEAKKPVKKAEPASEAKAAEAKKAKKPVKSAKTAAAAAKAAAETPTMPQIEIDGENYFHDRSNNGLWKVEEDDTFGAWVGYYQPNNEEEPIRHTDSME